VLTAGAPLHDPALLKQGFVQGAIATHRTLSWLGGGIASAGGGIEWFRAITGGVAHEALIAEGRAAGPGSHGVVFLPHLIYAPAPDPDTAARGAFVGLTAQAGRGALYRAVLEGLAMQARLMLEAMVALPGVRAPRELRSIGGTARNALLLEIKASVYGRPITVVDEPEATSLGAALLGGVAAGLWPDLDAALAALDRRDHSVDPQADLAAFYETLYETGYRGLQATLKPINRTLGGLAAGAEKTPPP
jgi:xylulokinase